MKNLLVDALRQAQEGSDETQAAGEPPEIPVDEIALEEPTVDDVQQWDDGELSLEADATDDPTPADVSVAPESEPSAADEQTESTTTVETAPEPEPDSRQAPLDEGSMAAPPGETTRRETVVSRQSIDPGGPMLPVVCGLLAVFSAGVHVVYQELVAANLNAGLGDISSGIDMRQTAEAELDSWGESANAAFLRAVRSVPERQQDRPDRPVAPQAEKTNLARAEIKAEAAPVTEDRIDRAYAKVEAAYAAYQSRDLAAAEELYRAALQIAPYHPSALGGLAATLSKASRDAESAQYFERLLRVEPQNTVAAAAILARRKQVSDRPLESELKVLLQQHPDAAHLHFALGLHLANEGRWPDARLAFTNAHDLNPENADYSYNLAVCLERLGQLDSARRHYETALLTAGSDSEFDPQIATDRVARIAATMDMF